MNPMNEAWMLLKNVSTTPNMENDPDVDHDPGVYSPNYFLQQGARNMKHTVPTSPSDLRVARAMANKTQARPTGRTSDIYGQAAGQNMNNQFNQLLGTNDPHQDNPGVGRLTDEQVQQILSNTGNFGGF